jgi:hypothetical protein
MLRRVPVRLFACIPSCRSHFWRDSWLIERSFTRLLCRSPSWDWLIRAGLLLTSAISLRFVAHYAVPYFGYDPAYFKDFWPHRTRLIFHICGGMLTLFCGPLQFWTGLRQRAMNFHRWTGKLYLLGVVVGAIGGYSLAVYSKPVGYGLAIMVMCTAWVFTTAVSYSAILRGLVDLHKQWMVRSYLVTFTFVTIRLIIENLPGVTVRLGGSLPERVINVVWISWLAPLALYELILQARTIFSARQTPSAARAYGQ